MANKQYTGIYKVCGARKFIITYIAEEKHVS